MIPSVSFWLCVWLSYVQAAPENQTLLSFLSTEEPSSSSEGLSASGDPTGSFSNTEEPTLLPEDQHEPTNAPNLNSTDPVTPSLLNPTSDPASEGPSASPDLLQTESPVPPKTNNTDPVTPSLLNPTSDPASEGPSASPDLLQTESPVPPKTNDTDPVTPSLLNPTSDPASEGPSASPDLLQTESPVPPKTNDTGLACTSLLPPRRGSYYVEQGTGVSVGSMLVFWCRDGYQLVGYEKITCILQRGVPRWSSFLPVCESIPRPNNHGLRVALLVSIVSGVVILVMTVCFIVCCCQESISRKKEKHRTGRSRRREKRSSRSRRSPSWLEREQMEWEAFPPPKLFSLSQRLDRPLPPGGPACSDVVRAYENRGYERSQESLLRSPRPTYPPYNPNGQIYPALVFQRVQTQPKPSTSSTTPVYVQISTPPKNKAARGPHVSLP